ncbi:MAG TPA: FGGY-family carbohydrate kinase [Solirubrobacteraceae bacterium]|nr:FGGY-family carbohydrate kinase [Solirubrobacteraceae bacterium]
MSDGAVVLVLDGGGSSFKAAVYSLAERAPVAVCTEEIAAQYPSDGIVEFDPAGWWARALAALRRVVESAARLPSAYVGVICTGMRIPFVLVDDRGDELAPGVLNVDRRGTPYLDEIRDALGPERLYELTGHWPNAKFGLPKLLWYARERPRLWQRVRRVLQFHDWLVFRLSGAHASEPSSAAMSQMVDVANRTWATELLDTVGLDSGLLPELHDAGEVVGGLTPEVAREIGLKSGTPVHAGGGDTHVASFGAGAVTPGTVCIVGGSTTPLMLAADEPTFGDPHSGPVISPHVRRGTWALETNAGATGIFYTWLRDLAGGADNGGYAELDRLAAGAALGAHGLVVAGPNPLWGEQGWARVPPTTFLGMTPAHSLGEVARAVLESIAYAQSSNFDVLTGDPSLAVDEVQFIGGASRSPFSCQMLADVLGREVYVPEVGEPFAAGGAALVAGERTPAQPERRTYVPDGERHREYQRQAAHHYDCYVQLQEQFGT